MTSAERTHTCSTARLVACVRAPAMAETAEGRSAARQDVAEEEEKKTVVVPLPPPPSASSRSEHDSKPPADDSMALVVFEKGEKKTPRGSMDTRDIALPKVETDKRTSLIKAWEESEKAKARNKAAQKISTILSWEKTKKASIEAQMHKKELELEKKKAKYAEKMKNKAAIVHRQAEEKRAMVVARRSEEFLKAEEMVVKYIATGLSPKKLPMCFGS